jgi:N-acetylglucosamine kinase-like BadF-type ATPase
MSHPSAGSGDEHGFDYWLGIDGGQSGLRSVVVRSDGTIHGTGRAGPGGPVLAPGGREALSGSLMAAIGEAMRAHPVPIAAAFLGLSGVTAGGRLEQAVQEAAATAVPAERIFVGTDTYAAWAGALALRPGLVALAGSGSGVTGSDGRGEVARAGGWGYLFGDEAGAFGIAREAIRLALLQLDTGAITTKLGQLISTHFGLSSVAEVPKALYAGEIDLRRVADLTPALAAAASNGDEALAGLFTSAAHVLAQQLVQVAGRLTWEHGRAEWAAVGGVFQSGPLLVDQIVADLRERSELRFVLVAPRFPPAIGAALLAAQRSGQGPDLVAKIVGGLDGASGMGLDELIQSPIRAAIGEPQVGR